ncbi:hypothetical protein BH23CHL5_BH23CHL5_23910 [soil metagenome]
MIEGHNQVTAAYPEIPGQVHQELKSIRRSSTAFKATMIVEALMSTAATAGPITMPHGANRPAASGMAITLYPTAIPDFGAFSDSSLLRGQSLRRQFAGRWKPE